MKMKSFIDKTVFITGGSSGIGLATAALLTKEGAHVVIFGRSREKLDKSIEELQSMKRSPEQTVIGVSLDVSSNEKVREVCKETIEQYGVPDVLINSAGRSVPGYFEHISYEQFDTTMKTNIYGIWNTVSTLVPYMKEKGGWIANVASLAGPIPLFGYTDYCASKAAIIAFSEVLRAEMRVHNIGVSVLLPPDTDTPGYREENRTKPPETQAVSAVSTVLSPESVACSFVKGIKKGSFIIIPTFGDRFFYFIKRVAPWLVDAVLAGIVAKSRKSLGSMQKGKGSV